MFRQIGVIVLLTMASKITASCDLTDVKTLLKGSSELKGLKVVSTGGTVVDDSNFDVVVPKEAFADEPVLRFSNADAKKFYTIIMVDPDAPNHPEGQFFLHMIKSNVPGAALKESDNGKIGGVNNSAYRKPSPPKGTGAHRYMWLVYEQRDGDGLEASAPDARAKFALAPWLRGKPLCGPVAAMQFRAKF